MTTTERTELGQEIETALDEVLDHLRGEGVLLYRIADDQWRMDGGGTQAAEAE